MNVLYSAVDIKLPDYHGGSTHVEEVVKSLIKLKNKVILVIGKNNGQKFHEKKSNLEIFRLPNFFEKGLLKTINYWVFSSLIFAYIYFFRKIDLVYERARIFGGTATIIGSYFKKKSILELNEPVIWVPLIKKDIKKNSFKHKLLKKIFNSSIKKASLITVTHESIKKLLPKNKTIVTDYGANPQKFNPNIKKAKINFKTEKNKTFLYSGSFQEWHAINKMLNGFNKAIKVDKKLKLILIGNGPLHEEAKKFIKKNNLEKNILLLGKISKNKLPSYINSADFCFALFDRKYLIFRKFNFFYSPIKIHEYKSMGKPVIASNFGNLIKIVKNKVNGFLVNEQNTDEIKKVIMKLVNSKKLVKNIQKNNRKDVLKKYNWNLITKNILSKIEN